MSSSAISASGTAQFADQLQHRKIERGFLRRRIGGLAQEGLGLVGLVARHVKPDQRLLDRVVGGEPGDHVAQLGLDLVVLGQPVQDPQAHVVKRAVLRLRLKRAVDGLQRLGIGLVGDVAVDLDLAQDAVVGALLEQGEHPVEGGLARGAVLVLHGGAVGGGGGQGLDPGVLGRGLDRGGGVAVEFVPLLIGKGHLAQGDAPVQIFGILFDQAQVLAVGLAQLALLAHDPGIGLARLAVRSVQVEDVAQLDQRAFHVILFEQGKRALVMALCAFLGTFAGRQRGHENEDRNDFED